MYLEVSFSEQAARERHESPHGPQRRQSLVNEPASGSLGRDQQPLGVEAAEIDRILGVSQGVHKSVGGRV
jgi:hypothetical protein